MEEVIEAGQYSYEECLKCSGTTSEVPMPHPIYSTADNIPVVQLTAVELGGFNGLNN